MPLYMIIFQLKKRLNNKFNPQFLIKYISTIKLIIIV